MASWSDAKINMMDEKAEEDMKVLIGLSMKVVLDNEMMKADKEVDREVDEMLFQFAFLLYDTIIIEKFPQALLEYEKHQRHGVKNT